MLLKIENRGGWITFDKVDRVNYCPDRILVENEDEIFKLIKMLDLTDSPLDYIGLKSHTILSEISKEHPLFVYVVSFAQGTKYAKVAIEGRAYICNDVGKTVDRLGSNGKVPPD